MGEWPGHGGRVARLNGIYAECGYGRLQRTHGNRIWEAIAAMGEVFYLVELMLPCFIENDAATIAWNRTHTRGCERLLLLAYG